MRGKFLVFRINGNNLSGKSIVMLAVSRHNPKEAERSKEITMSIV